MRPDAAPLRLTVVIHLESVPKACGAGSNGLEAEKYEAQAVGNRPTGFGTVTKSSWHSVALLAGRASDGSCEDPSSGASG